MLLLELGGNAIHSTVKESKLEGLTMADCEQQRERKDEESKGKLLFKLA